jgi:indolepyruvate ferredoxin oxidoreductase, beta subunit
MNRQNLNVLVAGVGGQGTVMLAKVIGRAAFRANLPVLTRETIGGFQRFGNVAVEIRLGEGTHSNTIDYACADVVVGMELLQALRYGLRYLKPDGTAIINTRKIFKPGNQRNQYPSVEQIVAQMRDISPHVHVVDGSGLAERAGNARMENMVLLGALAGANILPIPAALLRAEVLATVPAHTGEANVRAFELGTKAIQSPDATLNADNA